MPTDPKKTNVGTVEESRAYRLPRHALPSHYKLLFEPDFATSTFTGEVTIDLEFKQSSKTIVLNAKELEIFEASISGLEGVGSVRLDPEKEFATIEFPAPVSPGKHQLHIKFKGIHNDKLKGFYRSQWTDGQGNKRMLVCTQFESTDARRAFPCFDEPDFKATYEVSMIVPKDFAAISNGRPVEEVVLPAGDKKRVRFRPTMKMSTYLLAMIVGELSPSEILAANGVDLCVWALPEKTHLTSFALKIAAFTIKYFEEYFRVKYPDPDKCDLIAIPDFASGAMENKDCITFRETALLVDESTATHAELERVAEVVMHELAHMWFGDLVTMRWWNGLWLNEAFATFMEVKCLDAYKKEWRVWDSFGIGRAAAARVDSLQSTHPIECPVNRPEEAQELFDVISYRKGCSVLYQIEQFIGEEIFRNGITHYLNANAYSNTDTHDLWDSLEFACKEAGLSTPVRKIMDAWVFTEGHPLVSVTEDKAGGAIVVEQQQFKFLNVSAAPQLYPIPLALRVKSAAGQVETQKHLLNEKVATIKIGDNFAWVVVNAGGSGFYRVRYEAKLAARLTADINKNLSVIERFNLVNDTWASVRSGLTTAPEYLELISCFTHEDDVNVWSIITSSLHALRLLLTKDERAAFAQLVRNICGPQAKKLGWVPATSESPQTKQLRALLIDTMGTMGEDPVVIEEANAWFTKWKTDKAAIDANLLPALVNILAYNGNEVRYNEFRQISSEGKTPQEVIRFLYALAAFRDVSLLKKTMSSCLSADIKTQDAPYVFATIAQNEIATEAAWQFMKSNWKAMVESYPENGMVRMCAAVLPLLDQPPLEKDAQDFFAKHKVEAGDMAVAQGLELLRVNVLMREREGKRLGQYVLSRVAEVGSKAR